LTKKKGIIQTKTLDPDSEYLPSQQAEKKNQTGKITKKEQSESRGNKYCMSSTPFKN